MDRLRKAGLSEPPKKMRYTIRPWTVDGRCDRSVLRGRIPVRRSHLFIRAYAVQENMVLSSSHHPDLDALPDETASAYGSIEGGNRLRLLPPSRLVTNEAIVEGGSIAAEGRPVSGPHPSLQGGCPGSFLKCRGNI